MLKEYKDGDVILREGADDDHLYKIIKGKVEIYMGYETEGEIITGILTEGNYFGELGALTKERSIYTAVAHEDALIMYISGDDLTNFAKQNYKDLLMIMTNMAKTMLRLRKNIDLILSDVEALSNNISDINEAEKIKGRIRSSDIRQAMMMYSKTMGS